MTGAAFEVVFDDSQILGALDRVEAGLAVPGGLLERLGEYGVSSTQARFATQAGPDGTAWPGLNPAYALLKDATVGSGLRMLYAHGDLLASQHFRTGASEVRWGSGMVYAAVHQFGATIVPKNAKALSFVLGGYFLPGHSGAMGKTQGHLVEVQSVTIPARPYLGLSPVDAAEIEAISLEYLRSFI